LCWEFLARIGVNPQYLIPAAMIVFGGSLILSGSVAATADRQSPLLPVRGHLALYVVARIAVRRERRQPQAPKILKQGNSVRRVI
jgi:hypothetical protein